MKNLATLLVLVLSLSLTACLEPQSLVGTNSALSSFSGCISATGISNESIRVTFDFPSNADRVVIYRDGAEAGVSNNAAITSIIDSGRTEGVTYTYACEAYLGAKKISGANQVKGTPINSNAPVFPGIVSAASVSSSKVKVTWNPESSTGPRASSYQVFANVGTVIDWNASPRATLPWNGVFSTELTNLGDELPYVFGVRACTAQNICDVNTVVKNVTLPDGGAPNTQGLSAVTALNFIATLTAPWQDSHGAVSERLIYMCEGSSCAFGAPVKTIAVTDVTKPPTSLTVENINERTTYRFRVDDKDPSGNIKSSSSVISISTGDLTRPIFGGIDLLERGAVPNDDKQVIIRFTAIAREGTTDLMASSGASKYLLFMKSAQYPNSPGNACASGSPSTTLTPYRTLAVDPFAPGPASYTVSGLTERTNYSFCLVAQDLAGNMSDTSNSFSITTADRTVPDFSGVQSVAYNANTKVVRVSWNSSTSSDLRSYTLQVWKNTTTPAAADIKSFSVPPTNLTGRDLTATEFELNDYDRVYALVNACDNAADLGTSQSDNCTAFVLSQAKYGDIPDIKPPQGFLGIKGPSDQTSSDQGKVLVKWFAPAAWTDYYGFRVYSVEPTTQALTLLQTCNCIPTGNCGADATANTQCLIDGLNPGRRYRLHVRAVDIVGNATDYLTPDSSFAEVLVKDTTPPVFNSGFTNSGLTFSWLAATDNQYMGTGSSNTISYQIYRKTAATFASPFAPYTDGTFVTSVNTLTWEETSLTVGGTFYYAICAIDSANNRTCDGSIRSVSVADTIKPTIGTFDSSKTSDAQKIWNLTWTMNDDISSVSNLYVKIFERYDEDPNVSATTSDTVIAEGYGILTATNRQGPINRNVYINYLIQVRDQGGLIQTKRLTVHSKNLVTITAVRAAQGRRTGGRVLVIEGSGFSKAAENGLGSSTLVRLGSTDCLNISVINDRFISCTTPASAVIAQVDVRVQNPDYIEGTPRIYSSFLVPTAYYYVDETTSTDPCDSDTYRATNPFTDVTKGLSASDPFVICTRDQFSFLPNSMSGSPRGGRGGYTVLGDNIDFASNPYYLTANGTFYYGNLDGKGYSLLNNAPPSGSNFMLSFRGLTAGQVADIKNLNILNYVFESTFTAYGGVCNIFKAMNADATVNFTNVNVVVNVKNCSGFGPALGLIATPTIGTMNVKGLHSEINIPAKGSINIGAVAGYTSDAAKINIETSTSLIKMTVDSAAVAATSHYMGGFIGYISDSLTGYTKIKTSSSQVVYDGLHPVSGVTTGANRIGGVIGTVTGTGAATLEISTTKSYLDIRNIASTSYVGGMLGAATVSAAGSFHLTVSDSYTSGVLRGDFYRGGVASAMTTLSSGSSILLSRFYSALEYSIRTDARRYQACAYDTVNSSYNQSGVFNNSDLMDGLTAAAGSCTAVAHSTAELQNQAGGNAFDQAGYVFGTATPTWKWCSSANVYPSLNWETCP